MTVTIMRNGIPVTIDESDPLEEDSDAIETVPNPFGSVGEQTAGYSAEDSPSDSLVCEVCGDPLVYAGRGKYPKYCDIHKGRKSTAPNRTAGTAGDKGKNFPGEGNLRIALTAKYGQLAGLVGMATGSLENMKAIQDRIEMCVNADIEYARQNSQWRKALETTVEKTALVSVIAAHFAMFAPVVRNVRTTRIKSEPIVGPVAVPNIGSQSAAPNRPGPFARRNPSTSNAAPNPAPKPTDNWYPAETDRPSADTVNAGLIPGMPGVG